ncbi:MAG: hypothetical protein Q7T57_08680 [Dehalococcoidales bacterium]|nr:hypothetical protein [Dehalococcoidales bacterium]
MKNADIFEEIEAEYERATTKFNDFNSAHEGYAVILEELEELKAHVFLHHDKRDLQAMRKEAVQVAAMAIRFITDVC